MSGRFLFHCFGDAGHSFIIISMSRSFTIIAAGPLFANIVADRLKFRSLLTGPCNDRIAFGFSFFNETGRLLFGLFNQLLC